MDNEEKIVHEFMKNSREKVVASFATYHGQRLVTLWVCFKNGDDWTPMTKGLALRRELIWDLKEAVDKLVQEYTKESPGPSETAKP